MFGLFDLLFGSSKKKQVVFENEKPTTPRPLSRSQADDIAEKLEELRAKHSESQGEGFSRRQAEELEEKRRKEREYDAVDLAVDIVETAIVIDLVSDLFSSDSSSSDSTSFDTTSTDTTDWSGDGGGFSGGGASDEW